MGSEMCIRDRWFISPFDAHGAVRVRFDAVFKNRKTYGETYGAGAAVIYPTMRFGAVFRNWNSYGSVWCGSHKS